MADLGPIQETVNRYAEKKLAAEIDGTRVEGEAKSRLAISGMDLDLDELVETADAMAETAVAAARSGVPLAHILRGLWVDGLVTGSGACPAKASRSRCSAATAAATGPSTSMAASTWSTR